MTDFFGSLNWPWIGFVFLVCLIVWFFSTVLSLLQSINKGVTELVEMERAKRADRDIFRRR